MRNSRVEMQKERTEKWWKVMVWQVSVEWVRSLDSNGGDAFSLERGKILMHVL